MFERVLLVILLVITVNTVSCSTLDVERTTQENLQIVRNDNKDILSKVTKYELPLRRFGRDLSIFSPKVRVIGIAPIVNESPDKNIPKVISRMMVSTAVKMISSPLAQKYIYIVDLESVSDFYSFVLNLTPPPQVRIRIDGGITEGDVVLSKNINTNPEGTIGRGKGNSDLSANYEFSAGAEAITLDLNASIDGLTFPLGYASNTLFVYKREEGMGFTLSNNILGFSIGGNYNLNDSKSHAIRLLTEFSMIQLIGRITQSPYWHCYKINMIDKPLINYMHEEWETLSEREKWKRYANVLKVYLDYYVKKKINLDTSTEHGLSNVKELVKKLRSYFNVEDDILSFKSYFTLYNNMPFCSYPKDSSLHLYLNEVSKNLKLVNHLGKNSNTTSITELQIN